MSDCVNPTSSTKVKQCKWLQDRKLNECFDRDANDILLDIESQ